MDHKTYTNASNRVQQDDDFAGIESKTVASNDHTSHAKSGPEVGDNTRPKITQEVEE
jgi:hypothetical protein